MCSAKRKKEHFLSNSKCVCLLITHTKKRNRKSTTQKCFIDQLLFDWGWGALLTDQLYPHALRLATWGFTSPSIKVSPLINLAPFHVCLQAIPPTRNLVPLHRYVWRWCGQSPACIKAYTSTQTTQAIKRYSIQCKALFSSSSALFEQIQSTPWNQMNEVSLFRSIVRTPSNDH